MNQKQIALHWREWGKAVRAMQKAKVINQGTKSCDEARKQIYANLSHPCKSIKNMSNAQLTEFLAVCWAWSKADNLELQLQPFRQAAIVNKHLCKHIAELIQEVDPEQSEKGEAYFTAIYKQQNPNDLDPETGTWEQWHKVMLSMCYRYDQVCRKISGTTKKYSRRFWPSQHKKNLATLGITTTENAPF